MCCVSCEERVLCATRVNEGERRQTEVASRLRVYCLKRMFVSVSMVLYLMRHDFGLACDDELVSIGNSKLFPESCRRSPSPAFLFLLCLFPTLPTTVSYQFFVQSARAMSHITSFAQPAGSTPSADAFATCAGTTRTYAATPTPASTRGVPNYVRAPPCSHIHLFCFIIADTKEHVCFFGQ